MTEENYKYRTSQILLRNQFHGDGKFKIPIIPKGDFSDDDFRDLLLIGFDRTNLENNNHLDRMVHFFLYDYKFERVWKNPDNDIERLKRYRAVLSPDFSMYQEMNPTIQLYNTFRNRWCGAHFASKGIRVVPTVSWGDENTFDFCFKGIPKGSTVAVSTYMVSEHGNHADQKDFFLKGYREMLRQVEPERIICYNHPFPEMEGNIVFVDYTLSSWKYQNNDYIPPKYKKYICGSLLPPANNGTIIKSGHVLSLWEEKGMGSAFGGKWKPKKPEDERFLGKPGETKRTFIRTTKGGYWAETKIGADGRAIKERHYTDHGFSTKHSAPHDHIIDWSNGVPNLTLKPRINYFDGNVPEFKNHKEMTYMQIIPYDPEMYRFTSISDFKQCIQWGGEVQFEWKGKSYSVTWDDMKILIGESHYLDAEDRAHNTADDALVTTPLYNYFETPDEALEYMVAGDRLRDIITKVEVTERNR